jgi:menaquinone-dependent protoporphyrinogen oxidase
LASRRQRSLRDCKPTPSGSNSAVVEAGGHDVDVHNLRETQPEHTDDYDSVLVAASVHAGGYEREVRRWVRAHLDEIDAVPNAFVSVSLSAANHDAKSVTEMDAIVERFRKNTGWDPDRVVRLAGALVYSKYNWLLKRVMRNIVRKQEHGKYTDMTRDYDFTDFEQVRTFAHGFGYAAGHRVPIAVS